MNKHLIFSLLSLVTVPLSAHQEVVPLFYAREEASSRNNTITERNFDKLNELLELKHIRKLSVNYCGDSVAQAIIHAQCTETEREQLWNKYIARAMTIITHNKSTNIYSKKTMAMLHASNWPDFNTTNLLASGAVALIPTLIALGTSIHHNERTISISFQSTKWHLAIALIVPAIFLGLWLPHALRSIDWNTSQSIVTNLEIIRERYEKNLPPHLFRSLDHLLSELKFRPTTRAALHKQSKAMYYFYRTLIREANPERGNTGMLLEIMNELEVNASDTDQITDELIEAFALKRKKLEAAAAEQVSS